MDQCDSIYKDYKCCTHCKLQVLYTFKTFTKHVQGRAVQVNVLIPVKKIHDTHFFLFSFINAFFSVNAVPQCFIREVYMLDVFIFSECMEAFFLHNATMEKDT